MTTDADASAMWGDTLNTTGWGTLDVTAAFGGEYAAGYLEGILTSHRIFENYHNEMSSMFGPAGPSEALRSFLRANWAYVRVASFTWHPARPSCAPLHLAPCADAPIRRPRHR